MGKKNRSSRKHKNNNLAKIVLLLPHDISAEEIVTTLIEARKICTQVTYYPLPGMSGKLEAWCTPRQVHDFGNFIHQVFKIRSQHDGDDIHKIRSYIAARTEGHALDAFNLPADTKRLNLRYGATGFYTSIVDYPAYRESEELLTIAYKMCDLSPQLRSEVTNDLSLYRQIAVSAYMAGYQLGIALIRRMSKEEQAIFTSRFVEDDLSGKGPLIIAFFADRLRQQMNDQNVETVEALL
jgi:hypothetical protein